MQVPRRTGLGVFFLNTQSSTTSAAYIKVILRDSALVLMAEAAPLALAAQIALALGIQCPMFLSDNQQLVTFLDGNGHTNPPY